jgi:DNA gyrase subunit A
MLFFSSGGKAYKLKVWRLPVGAPTSRGKAFINLFPIELGETMTSILALPEDEAAWEGMDVMFATRSGGVRRNKLSDFVNIHRGGKIAMKLDEGDAIVGVSLCTHADDVLLSSAMGRCIRFAVDDVRVFRGRDSDGVRGIRLAEGDRVLSMAILAAVDATPAERAAYLKLSRAGHADEDEAAIEDDESLVETVSLSPERFEELRAAEQFVLAVSSEGFGKRTSAYDYRRTGRGGQGLIAQDLSKRGGRLVGSFPVLESDQMLLVTDQGQLIRLPVAQIRIAGRNTQGVTLFRTAAEEHVVSAERLEGEAAEEIVEAEELGETEE